MENQTQKWVNLSYVAVSALLGALVFWSFQRLTGVYDLETKIKKIQVVIPVTSILCGFALFLALSFNKKANAFMNEAVMELMKVTWPSHKEVVSSTVVVIIMVLISSFFLGLLDRVWTLLLKWII